MTLNSFPACIEIPPKTDAVEAQSVVLCRARRGPPPPPSPHLSVPAAPTEQSAKCMCARTGARLSAVNLFKATCGKSSVPNPIQDLLSGPRTEDVFIHCLCSRRHRLFVPQYFSLSHCFLRFDLVLYRKSGHPSANANAAITYVYHRSFVR